MRYIKLFVKSTIIYISLSKLFLSLIPSVIVVGILFLWVKEIKNYIYAFVRMFAQLLILGYILTYIFNADKSWIVILCLTFMCSVASWIALRPLKEKRKSLFAYSLIPILISGSFVLFLITQIVLNVHPWYSPKELIPLGGMIFSSSMNSISLASERFFAEIKRMSAEEALKISYKTSLIPITNMLFAVGIVSIPGVMTGQVLSGISPLLAVRYQIVVLSMIFGSAGISSAIFLKVISSKKELFNGV